MGRRGRVVLGCAFALVAAGCAEDGASNGGDSGPNETGAPEGTSTTTGAPDPTGSSGGESSTGPSSTSAAGASTGAEDGSTGASPSFCPPELSPQAQTWRAEYDVFFADPSSMRRYLPDLESGSGHWGQTYTLRSLVLMYELTGELDYLHELMWQGQVLRELAQDEPTWPTGVCGNTFSHSTVVIDGRFLTPLLDAAWWMQNSRLADEPLPQLEGVSFDETTYGELATAYADLATAVLAGHDSEMRTIGSESFGPYEGATTEYYRFPSSYSCVSGDVQPFNYANSAGSAYLGLWRLTGDDTAREHAERIALFWWNRTYAHEPSPGSTRSRWWGYRAALGARFDPDSNSDAHRPEDVGHADMTSSFAAALFREGLADLNGTRIDQVAMSSKRWVDRAVNGNQNVSYAITNDDTDGDWDDMFDHLPMACYRASILEDLTALAPVHLTSGDGSYRRNYAENLAELAYLHQYTGSQACAPRCGDGVCSGPEDWVGCAADCSPC